MACFLPVVPPRDVHTLFHPGRVKRKKSCMYRTWCLNTRNFDSKEADMCVPRYFRSGRGKRTLVGTYCRTFESKMLAGCARHRRQGRRVRTRTRQTERGKNKITPHLDGDLPDALSGVRVAHDSSTPTQLRDLLDGLKRSHLARPIIVVQKRVSKAGFRQEICDQIGRHSTLSELHWTRYRKKSQSNFK